MSIFFSNLIYRLGKKLMLRQIPIATANVYFKRFYSKNAICETDPFMVAACCVYVAAKVDETPVHIKSVVSEARATFSEFNYRGFPVDYTKLAEMEFYLLEDLEFDLVVYHPYRTLAAVCGREAVDAGDFSDDVERDIELSELLSLDSSLNTDAAPPSSRDSINLGQATKGVDAARKETEKLDRLFGRGSGKPGSDVEDSILQMAWFILNDTYRTDLSILYAPYIIALAALYLSFSLEDKSPRDPFRVRGQTVSSLDRTNLTTSDLPRGEVRSAMDRLIIRAKAAGYFADFAISIPTMLTIVQEIISLYPLWEELEGRNTFSAVKVAQNEGDHQETTSSVPYVKPADSLRENEIVPMIQKMQRARAVESSTSVDDGVDGTRPTDDGERTSALNTASGKNGDSVAGVKRRQPD
ncbi:hypothetical protein QFC21_003399 [Naganishia friedmannii]|uniref:Uncharacterized protein n=1 Tax=Naganishia friedmannii TaxID=89922 RepID=A0ACC2VPZ0_9TREE|nr:hypothetical protein QFC21_003399 [Naganishia friedmannii]